MTGAPVGKRGSAQVTSLNAIRGLAAIQVVLFHFATAYIPSLVAADFAVMSPGKWIELSPLSILYDGNLAVYIFFTLSGYVLTAPFSKRTGMPGRAIAARLVRLGLPAIAACIFAAVVYAYFGTAHVMAGQFTGSAWYAGHWFPDMSLLGFFRDAILSGLFFGYQGMPQGIGELAGYAGLGHLADSRIYLNNGLVPVLWTLSLEFAGSILVFVLCWLRNRSESLWLLIFLLACVFFARSYAICFLVGHLAATWRFAEREDAQLPVIASVALVVFGVAFAVYGGIEPHLVQWSRNICTGGPLYRCTSAANLPKTYSAILILAGILSILPVRKWLSGSHLDGVGRMSFPLYLTHWPVLYGPVAAAFVYLAPRVGVAPATGLVCLAGLALCFAVAIPFQRIDQLAMALSRAMQKRQDKPSAPLTQQQVPAPAATPE